MRSKTVIIVLLLIISLALSACGTNNEISAGTSSNKDALIAAGRDLTKKLIENYYDSKTDEELEENISLYLMKSF